MATMNSNQESPLDPLEGEVYGSPNVSVLPTVGERTSVGTSLASSLFQYIAIQNTLQGPKGGFMERVWGSGVFRGGLSEFDAQRNRARAIMEVADRNPGMMSAREQRLFKGYRDLAKKSGEQFLTPKEQRRLDRLGRRFEGVVDRNPSIKNQVLREGVARQSDWMSARVANKVVMGSVAVGLGYDTGGWGIAGGAGLMATGLGLGAYTFADTAAKMRGHSSIIGAMKNTWGHAVAQGRHVADGIENVLGANKGPAYKMGLTGPVASPQGVASTAAEAGKRPSSALIGKAADGIATEGRVVASNLSHQQAAFMGEEAVRRGGAQMSRSGALVEGAKRAVGRKFHAGLSPRNFMGYGALMAAGGAASVLTRAPVGARLSSRFSGSEQTMAMLNDPQNVEARMLAMSHLQQDGMSAANAMGRESKRFIRQWSGAPDPSFYGLR